MMAKRKKKIDLPPESKLQQSIVVAYYDRYPERENDLIGYDANGSNGAEGAAKLGMGVRKSVSDLMWFSNHRCHGLELKTENSRHDSLHVYNQAKFIVEKCGQGAFITSVEMFWDYIEGRGKGIPAQFVMDYIKKTGVKTILFSNLLALLKEK